MKSLVVLFALASVACGSLIVAQPPHHPAIVLDPHGRPLDTADVINARAVHLQAKALEGHYAPLVHHAAVAPIAHSVIAPAAAVSHQSRVDVHSSPAVIAAAPVVAAHAAPVLGHSVLGLGHGIGHGIGLGHGHWLKKRSLGHLAYGAHYAPALVAAPAAVSHQSRVDVLSSPAVVSHAVAAPYVAHAAPLVAAVAPAAVSHQSRVDVRTSPAVVAHAAVAPIAHSVVAPLAHSVVAAPYAHSGLYHSAHLGHHGW